MREGSRAGFTLVELLVVISIIGMLIALLLPAVNAARETARSANCLSNMTQLGKALISFESRQGAYPGYNNIQASRSYNFSVTSLTLSGSRRSSATPSPTGWVFPLLTYLDRNDLTEQFGPRGQDVVGGLKGVPPRNVMLSIVRCPSDINVDDEGPAGASYVVNTGLEDVTKTTFTAPKYISIDVAVDDGESPDYPANGAFHNRYPFKMAPSDQNSYETLEHAPTGAASRLKFKEVQTSANTMLSGDGTTNTLLLSENIDGGRWTDFLEHQVGFICAPARVGNAPAKPSDPNAILYSELCVPTRSVARVLWINEQPNTKTSAVPALPFLPPTNNPCKWARPSSYHANGVNVVFAGGNGRFLTDAIDPLVYVQLMTPHGSKMVAPSKNGPDAATVPWQAFAQPLDEGAF